MTKREACRPRREALGGQRQARSSDSRPAPRATAGGRCIRDEAAFSTGRSHGSIVPCDAMRRAEVSPRGISSRTVILLAMERTWPLPSSFRRGALRGPGSRRCHQRLTRRRLLGVHDDRGANPGDEVISRLARMHFASTYSSRRRLRAPSTFTRPTHRTPPSWIFLLLRWASSTTRPGSYTGGDKARGCWQLSGAYEHPHRWHRLPELPRVGLRLGRASVTTTGRRASPHQLGLPVNDNGLTGGTIGGDGTTESDATVEFTEFSHERQPLGRPESARRTTSTSTEAPSRSGTRTCTTPFRDRTSTAAPSRRPSNTTGSSRRRATSAT